MNYYALVKGQLVCIDNCGDRTAAYEVACDAIGDAETRHGGKAKGNGMNYYALVKGQLVCIGNCADWPAAYEVACDALGETEWDWLASEEDVSQWMKVFAETRT